MDSSTSVESLFRLLPCALRQSNIALSASLNAVGNCRRQYQHTGNLVGASVMQAEATERTRAPHRLMGMDAPLLQARHVADPAGRAAEGSATKWRGNLVRTTLEPPAIAANGTSSVLGSGSFAAQYTRDMSGTHRARALGCIERMLKSIVDGRELMVPTSERKARTSAMIWSRG
eukprot:scaffold152_cov383-Prasinococcus_capsulatus_cf.AAC.5